MIVQALLNLRPGAEWNLSGTTYDDIVWLDSIQTLPSQEEIDTEILRINQEYERLRFQRQRAPEYPPLQDFADAMYWHRKGDDTKLDAYVAACDAVKARYPKGE